MNGKDDCCEEDLSSLVIVSDGRLDKFFVCHECVVCSFDDAPFSCEDSNDEALLDGRPKGIAVGDEIVFDNFMVADAV